MGEPTLSGFATSLSYTRHIWQHAQDTTMKKPDTSEQSINPLFTVTIFLASFLAFAVEPLFSKLVLPTFGGSAMVWTTSSLFFQIMLLASYSYSFILEKLSWPLQRFTYVLTALAIIFVSSTTLVGTKLSLTELPSLLQKLSTANEVTQIITVGLLSMGVAFFFLGTISTSIQILVAHKKITNPYILYRASNLGSFMGLFSYPLLLEPFFTSHQLSSIWALLALLVTGLVGALYALAQNKADEPTKPSINTVSPSLKEVGTWILLAAFPVALLLAITNQITLGIAPIPYLWILPLGAYLLGYIIAFGIYRLEPLLMLLLISCSFTGLMTLTHNKITISSYTVQIMALLAVTTLSSLLFHAKAYSLRPPKSKLSYFYLSLAFGGTVGGFLVSIIAPLLFKTYLEIELLLIGGIIYTLIQYSKHRPLEMRIFATKRIITTKLLIGITLFVLATFMTSKIYIAYTDQAIYQARNFYGTLSVNEKNGERTLANGTIIHGTQYLGERATIPTTYYSKDSGIGKSLDFYINKSGDNPLKVGVVGLGTGSLASYCRPNDQYDFFEINEQVIQVAKEYFTYLDHCQNSKLILGDARKQLALQNFQSEDAKYDLLAIDAFTDDAIPTHLLTIEASTLYLAKIKHDGALLFHISNRYLELEKVLNGFAAKEGLISKKLLHMPVENDLGVIPSVWVLITRSEEAATAIANSFSQADTISKSVIWTDDYSNILKVIKFGK